MKQVGIIANPASGKDIRRLVAYGTVFDNQEKVNMVRRMILGLAATGIDSVLYMPDYYGIVPKAADGIGARRHLAVEFEPVDMCLTATGADSCYAAAVMAERGVGCIITMGGDGTNRLVAKGCGAVPVLPVSTGTNNVLPTMVEGTIAGLAAGVVAGKVVDGPPAVNRCKKLVVYKNGVPVDSALVDAVVLTDNFIGARAIWDAARITQLVVTRGEAHNIGISSIAGNLAPVGALERRGLAVDIGDGPIRLFAPIAPGLIESVKVKHYRYVEIGEVVDVTATPCIIALDGEREVEIGEGDTAQIQLTFDGPNIVNVEEALRQAVAKGYSAAKSDA